MKNALALALSFCAVALLDGCGGASLVPPTVTISASPATIGVPQSTMLTWSSTNALSCAVSASPAESDWTGTVAPNGSRAVAPAAAGSVTYMLTCTGPGGSASNTTTITVNSAPAPAIAAAVPPDGVLNVPYIFQFLAANGVQPLTWTETGALPAGLTLSTQGAISGTPTVTGPFTINVHVVDSANQSAAQMYSISIQLHGFQATGDMAAARTHHTATLLNTGKVLVAGGNDGTNALATAELYDPATGIFTSTTGAMTRARTMHTATLLANGPAATNGKVLLTGGDGSNQSAELFDPVTETFTATAGTMNSARELHTATLLNNGKVLLAGGYGNSTAELFDPATGTFSATGSMSQQRGSATATLLTNGMVLVAGGEDQNLESTASAEVYNSATGTFTATTGDMTEERALHTATLLSNGMVLITGGFGEDPEISSADLFDPTTGNFSLTGTMAVAREGHTATVLGDGTVLIVGGPSGSNGDPSRAEIFDPVHGTFTIASKMETTRTNHTATLLANGHVLVIGGSDNSGVVLKSADLYN